MFRRLLKSQGAVRETAKSQVAARGKGDARMRAHSKSLRKTDISHEVLSECRKSPHRFSNSNFSPSVAPGTSGQRWAEGLNPFGILRTDHLHASRGHSRVSSRDSPVSNRLLRLARMCGQPVDTASMNFEPSLSIS